MTTTGPESAAGQPPEPPSDVTSTFSLGGSTSAPSDEHDDTGEHHVGSTEVLVPGTALLVVQRGPNAGSRYLLEDDVTTTGRHHDAAIFLDDVTVSRRHAEFRREPSGGFRVVDVGSLNGTYVNRQRIDDALLSGGDEVQIGKYRLLYFPAASAGGAG